MPNPLPLTKLVETPTKITFGWQAVPGAVGYRFQSSTQAPKWSHTFDAERREVTFSKAEWYKVEALGVEAAGEFPVVTPDPGTSLPWAPPVAGSGGVAVVNWTMTNANRQSSSLLSGGGRDLVITSGEPLTGPVQQLHGWRHVIWIGGKITLLGTGNNYALPISATGTVHLEGLDIRCDGDALMSRGGGPNCVWQIQNCRIEVHFNGGSAEHSDCFQSQGGSKINELRVARCTMLTDYQGFFLRLATPDAFLNGGDFRQLNFRRRSGMGDPAQAWIFIPDEDAATGHGPGQPQVGDIDMTDVWIDSTWDESHNWIFHPSWRFDSGLSAGGAYSIRRGCFKETDATSDYLRPSTTGDVVPPGGAMSGQSCLSPHWTGIVRYGIPVGGDYCPATVPGRSYASPGYQ